MTVDEWSAPTLAPARFTPCSAKHGKHCSPAHAALVRDYRDARHAAWLQREAATLGYATELSEYPPIVTFRDWLVQHRH